MFTDLGYENEFQIFELQCFQNKHKLKNLYVYKFKKIFQQIVDSNQFDLFPR